MCLKQGNALSPLLWNVIYVYNFIGYLKNANTKCKHVSFLWLHTRYRRHLALRPKTSFVCNPVITFSGFPKYVCVRVLGTLFFFVVRALTRKPTQNLFFIYNCCKESISSPV
jgi:hypothetical protein